MWTRIVERRSQTTDTWQRRIVNLKFKNQLDEKMTFFASALFLLLFWSACSNAQSSDGDSCACLSSRDGTCRPGLVSTLNGSFLAQLQSHVFAHHVPVCACGDRIDIDGRSSCVTTTVTTNNVTSNAVFSNFSGCLLPTQVFDCCRQQSCSMQNSICCSILTIRLRQHPVY